MLPSAAEQKLKIFVCCHKEDPMIRRELPYVPLQVGKALHPDLDLGILTDDSGDNISAKNESYCELTGLYWIWKNETEATHLGLCHYRRYFDIDEKSLETLLETNDIVVLSPYIHPHSVAREMYSLASQEDLALLFDELLRPDPSYFEDIRDYYFNSNKFYRCNMFVARKEVFDAYAQFLFEVLGRLEKRLSAHSYSRQKRVMGYLAESLLGLWIRHNHLKAKELEMNDGAGRKSQRKSLKLLRNLSFRLGQPRNFKRIPIYSATSAGLKSDGIDISALLNPRFSQIIGG